MHPAYVLFGLFFLLIFAGVPIAAALGLAGTVVIAIAGLGIMAVPTSVYTGMAKYPLLAIPMFVLAGAIFDRSGVAARLLRFATAIIGQGLPRCKATSRRGPRAQPRSVGQRAAAHKDAAMCRCE